MELLALSVYLFVYLFICKRNKTNNARIFTKPCTQVGTLKISNEFEDGLLVVLALQPIHGRTLRSTKRPSSYLIISVFFLSSSHYMFHL